MNLYRATGGEGKTSIIGSEYIAQRIFTFGAADPDLLFCRVPECLEERDTYLSVGYGIGGGGGAVIIMTGTENPSFSATCGPKRAESKLLDRHFRLEMNSSQLEAHLVNDCTSHRHRR